MLKKQDFSPAQPWRLPHPPALSLPNSLFAQGRALSEASLKLRS